MEDRWISWGEDLPRAGRPGHLRPALVGMGCPTQGAAAGAILNALAHGALLAFHVQLEVSLH